MTATFRAFFLIGALLGWVAKGFAFGVGFWGVVVLIGVFR